MNQSCFRQIDSSAVCTHAYTRRPSRTHTEPRRHTQAPAYPPVTVCSHLCLVSQTVWCQHHIRLTSVWSQVVSPILYWFSRVIWRFSTVIWRVSRVIYGRSAMLYVGNFQLLVAVRTLDQWEAAILDSLCGWGGLGLIIVSSLHLS